MTKLRNGLEYNNPHFPETFANYLLDSGFQMSVRKGTLYFFNDLFNVNVIGENFDVFSNDIVTTQTTYKGCYLGLGLLNLQGFIMVLHAMGIVRVQDFIAKSNAVSDEQGDKAISLIKSVIHSLKPANSHA